MASDPNNSALDGDEGSLKLTAPSLSQASGPATIKAPEAMLSSSTLQMAIDSSTVKAAVKAATKPPPKTCFRDRSCITCPPICPAVTSGEGSDGAETVAQRRWRRDVPRVSFSTSCSGPNESQNIMPQSSCLSEGEMTRKFQ